MKRLKASTLIESLVSLVIISLSLGFGTMAVSSVLGSSQNSEKLRAIEVLNRAENNPAALTVELQEREIVNAPGVMIHSRIVRDKDGNTVFVERSIQPKETSPAP